MPHTTKVETSFTEPIDGTFCYIDQRTQLVHIISSSSQIELHYCLTNMMQFILAQLKSTQSSRFMVYSNITKLTTTQRCKF